MKFRGALTGLAIAFALALPACDSPGGASEAAAQTAQNVVRPGLGEDPGAPAVSLFNLPAGVRVAGTIKGAAEFTGECEGASEPPLGSGAYVQVCVPLENVTGGPVQIEFPEGLVVVSTSEGRNQHGLLIERSILTVPPTTSGGVGGLDREEEEEERKDRQDVFMVALYAYCLNEERDPSNPYLTYAIAGVTTDDALLELLRLLMRKKIDSPEDVGVVQNAIYSITEGAGLTREDRAALAKL